jgi:tetrahydromethanopterin S-methyltransferase subunit A
LDTGESYIRSEGVWTFINLGLSFIKATKSGQVITNNLGIADVVFNSPFITPIDYHIVLGSSDSGNIVGCYSSNLTAYGFRITTRDKNGHVEGNISVSWVATRDYNP